jgi:gamma-glutamylcyclotransferase (GGCT)/AIG2-like uncharacterized protein YtfP
MVDTGEVTTALRLYFAYGSNLDPEQMDDRCPGAVAAGVARLDRWRFRIANRGYATIVGEPAATVWGGLWWLTPGHEATLDEKEGVAGGHYRREFLDVITVDHQAVSALVYVEAHRHDAPPKAGYLERILRGAEWFGLPDAYRDELASWAR